MGDSNINDFLEESYTHPEIRTRILTDPTFDAHQEHPVAKGWEIAPLRVWKQAPQERPDNWFMVDKAGQRLYPYVRDEEAFSAQDARQVETFHLAGGRFDDDQDGGQRRKRKFEEGERVIDVDLSSEQEEGEQKRKRVKSEEGEEGDIGLAPETLSVQTVLQMLGAMDESTFLGVAQKQYDADLILDALRALPLTQQNSSRRRILLSKYMWSFFYFQRYLADRVSDPTTPDARQLIRADQQRYAQFVADPSSSTRALLGGQEPSPDNLWFRIYMYRVEREQEAGGGAKPFIDLLASQEGEQMYEPPEMDLPSFEEEEEEEEEEEDEPLTRSERERRVRLEEERLAREDPRVMHEELIEELLPRTVRITLSNGQRLVQWSDPDLPVGTRSHVWEIRDAEVDDDSVAILPDRKFYPTVTEARQLYVRVLDGIGGRLLNLERLKEFFEENPRYQETSIYQQLSNFVGMAAQARPNPQTSLQVFDDTLLDWYRGVETNGTVLLFEDHVDADDPAANAVRRQYGGGGGGGGGGSQAERMFMGFSRTIHTPLSVFRLSDGQLPRQIFDLLDNEVFCAILKSMDIIYQDTSIDARDLVQLQFLMNHWWRRRQHGVPEQREDVDSDLVEVLVRDDMGPPRWFTNLFQRPWMLDMDAYRRAAQAYPDLFGDERDNERITLNRSISELVDMALDGAGGVESQELLARWTEIVVTAFPSPEVFSQRLGLLDEKYKTIEDQRVRAWERDLLCRPVIGVVKNKDNAMQARYIFKSTLGADEIASEKQQATARWADAIAEQRRQTSEEDVMQEEEEGEDEGVEVDPPSPPLPQEGEQPTLFPGGDPAMLFPPEEEARKVAETRRMWRQEGRRLLPPERRLSKQEYEQLLVDLGSVPQGMPERDPAMSPRSYADVVRRERERQASVLESPTRKSGRARKQVQRLEMEDPRLSKLDVCARPKAEVFAGARDGMLRYYDPSKTLVILFDNLLRMEAMINRDLAVLPADPGTQPQVEIRPSEALGGIPGLFTSQTQSYRVDDIITGYSGMRVLLNDPKLKEELERNEHLLTVYGTQSKWVVMGLTSEDVQRAVKPQFVGSLANDAVDLRNSIIAAQALQPETMQQVIIKRAGQVNAEFVPLMTYETYCAIQDGEITDGTGVIMALVAKGDIGPGEEIFASYGDGYWQDYVWKVLRGERPPLSTEPQKTSSGGGQEEEGVEAVVPKSTRRRQKVVDDFVEEGPFELKRTYRCKPGQEELLAAPQYGGGGGGRTAQEVNVVITEHSGAIWTELYRAYKRRDRPWLKVTRGNNNPEDGNTRLLIALVDQFESENPGVQVTSENFSVANAWPQLARILPQTLPVIADLCLRRNAGIQTFQPNSAMDQASLVGALLRWSMQFTATDNKHYHMWTGATSVSRNVNRALLAFSIQFNRTARRFTLEIELACGEMDWPGFSAAEECTFLMMVRASLGMYRTYVRTTASRKVLDPQMVVILHNVRAMSRGAVRVIGEEVMKLSPKATKDFSDNIEEEVQINPQFGRMTWILDAREMQETVAKVTKKQLAAEEGEEGGQQMMYDETDLERLAREMKETYF